MGYTVLFRKCNIMYLQPWTTVEFERKGENEMKGYVVGVAKRESKNKQTGEVRELNFIYVVWHPTVQPAGVRGKRCEEIYVKFDVSDIKEDTMYEFETVRGFSCEGRPYTAIDGYAPVKQ